MPTQRRRGGPFGGPTFKAKWYTLAKPDGSEVKVQGTYERAYAQYLIDNNINFVAQPKPSLTYIDRFGGKHQYTPDFFVDGVGYVEIKSKFTLARGAKKLEEVKTSGHIITVYTEVELAELFGIDLKSKRDAKEMSKNGKNQSRPKGRKRRVKTTDVVDGTDR